MALKDDIVKFVVDIQSSGNQKKLIADLKAIESQSASLREEQEDLRKAMAHLQLIGQKNSDTYKELDKVFKENEAQLKKNAASSKALQAGLDKSFMSADQLQVKAKQLTKELNGMSKAANPTEYARLESELNQINAELEKTRKGAKNVSEGFLAQKFSVVSLKESAKELLPAFGIGAIVSGIAIAGKSLYDLKKQMDGEGRRAAIVFGDSLRYVEGQATQLAEKMGLTNREFVAAAAGTADLLVPLGFTRQQSAEMSVQMTKLSGALDEWTAGKYGAVEISSRLTRAVLGETDSLKELGIGIRLDSQEYKDLVKQKKEAGAATDAQAQALAIMDMVLQKSTDAQNAYAGSGNDILRLEKSLASSWQRKKENLVDYLTLSSDERLKKMSESIISQNSAMKQTEQRVEDLLATYERLASKTKPTKDEQLQLNKAIQDLATFAPSSITKIDAYGNAMSISAGKVREALEAQRLLNKEMNKNAINEINNSVIKESAAGMLGGDIQTANTATYGIKANQGRIAALSSKKVIYPKDKEEIDAAGIRLKDAMDRLKKANENIAQKAIMLKELGQSFEETAGKWHMSEKSLTGIIDNYMKTVKPSDSGGGSPDPSPEKDKKAYSLSNDKQYQASALKLKREFADGSIMTEEEYSKKSLELEIKTLQSKLDKGKLSNDERLDVEHQLLDKRISLLKIYDKEEEDAQRKQEELHKKRNDALQKLTEVAEKYGIKVTEDKLVQYQLQEQAEIEALDKSLEGTREYEIAKKAIHDYYANLISEEEFKRKNNAALKNAEAKVLEATTLENEYQAKVELENIKYEQEKQRLIEQHLSTEALEQEHNQRLLALAENYKQQRIAIASAIANASNGLLSAMSSFYESQKQRELKAAGNDAKKKEQIEKEYAKKQQKIAVAQALIAGAMAIMQIWSGKITGNPLIDAVIKGVLTAAQVVTTGMQVAAIKNQQFKEGGYTSPDSSDNTPVGVVHANEFVATADATRNPTVKPVLDVLDSAQRNKTIRTLDLRQVLNSGFLAGGYTTSTTNYSTSQQIKSTSTDSNSTALDRMATAAENLTSQIKKGIRASVSMLGPDGFIETQNEYNNWTNNVNM